jgi:predicted dehydrogenase
MVSRREFIKMAGAGAAALAAGAADPLRGFSAAAQDRRRSNPAPVVPPGEKIKVALIGIGNRGQQNAQEIIRTGMADVVALCDVNMGARHTQWTINQFPNVPRYQDFRKMFDEMAGQIEAVFVSTPDFSHFPIAMRAVKEGIHVYCEKPMCRTFLENQLLIDVALKNPHVVTQMGNQGHSGENYFQFKALVESGLMHDVTHITSHMNSSRRWHGYDVNMKTFPVADPMPDTMDWDVWLMQAAHHDYSKQFDDGNWRSWYDFGNGALGDWGAHIFDTCHEFLDLGLPYEVGMLHADGHNDFFFPMESTIQFKFPRRGNMPACDLTWYDGIKNLPELPAGFGVSQVSDVPLVAGQEYVPIELNPGKEIYTNDLIFKGGSHSATLEVVPKEKNDEMAAKGLLPELPDYHFNHYINFFNAIKGTEKAHSPFEKAGVLCQMINLGCIAQRLNTTFHFDRATKEITDNPFANAMLAGTPPRKGWEEYYVI